MVSCSRDLREDNVPFAPRPHVELVHVVDLPAREILLPGADRPARLITLSASHVNGAISAILDLPPGWTRQRGANPVTFTEWFLLAGDLAVGEELLLLANHYYRTAQAVAMGPLRTVHGARLLFFTEGDPFAWQPVAEPAPALTEGITHVDTNQVAWIPSIYPGPPVHNEQSRLWTKLLYMGEEHKTRLVMAGKDWYDHRTSHHPCVEEMFTLRGHMVYNFGVLEVDTYFYRPPRVKHGFFQAYPDGTTWLIRCDGDLENIYTQPDGTPVNWSYGTEREPVWVDPATLVRSQRAGPWSGAGQHIPRQEYERRSTG
ncbi:MAG: hypothetical protein KatS3mg061_0965 [Dehalococcoidia bacterium]|nr:MAG: hypothetical protein KatS3mg061_0965 [Dehalococcoidia bacterium]